MKAKSLAVAKPFVVIGADMDAPLVKSLVEGDEVLMEMNGMRVSSKCACPLVAEQPWKVVRNDKKELVLRHERVMGDLSLPYDTLLSTARHSPAVFKINNPAYCTGPIYTILQFVGFRCTEEQVDELFPTPFDEDACREALEDDRVKVGLLEQWGKTLKTFRLHAFGYRSIKRISMRTQVREELILAIRELEWDKILDIEDNQLVAIHREMCWMPHFLQQSGLIHHDSEREYQKPEAA
jgi:hypothetical protein